MVYPWKIQQPWPGQVPSGLGRAGDGWAQGVLGNDAALGDNSPLQLQAGAEGLERAWWERPWGSCSAAAQQEPGVPEANGTWPVPATVGPAGPGQ